MDKPTPTRREVVRLTLVGATAWALGCAPEDGENDDADTSGPPPDTGAPGSCSITGDDIEGPFYISDAPVRSDLDTWGDEGLRIRLSGVIQSTDCIPLAGAVIEIWHADDEGAYDNDSADMRYRGQQATDSEGRYAFETLVPGRYLNGGTYRPAHIHVKIWVDGVERLTTQLYFDDDPYNEGDAWYEASRSMAIEDHGDGTADCVDDFSV